MVTDELAVWPAASVIVHVAVFGPEDVYAWAIVDSEPVASSPNVHENV